jgi:glycosyltransferase 2 family protein
VSRIKTLLRRRLVRLGLVAATSGGALGLFLFEAHPGRLWVGLSALPPSAAITAVVATMAGVTLGAVRWRWLLAAGGVDVSAPRLFAALTAGAAVNNLVPARGGDAVRVESVRQQAGAGRLAVAGTLLAERILDGFVLAALVLVGALLAGVGGPFLMVGAGAAGLAMLGALAAPRLGGRLRGRLAGLEAGVAVFRAPRALAASLAASGGIWLADVVMYGALARGFHLDASLGAILLIVGAGNLALAIPATAAGIGSFELVTLAGAHGIGAGGPELAAFVFAVHAVIVLPPTLVGASLAKIALPGAFRFRSPAVAPVEA